VGDDEDLVRVYGVGPGQARDKMDLNRTILPHSTNRYIHGWVVGCVVEASSAPRLASQSFFMGS